MINKEDNTISLSKYIACAGVCARRKGVELVKAGQVKINGEVVMQPGYKVLPTDKVMIAGKYIKPETKKYFLLNKPKDCITTVTDQSGRKTVMDVIRGAVRQRVYPVGRLDRHTTGLLLFTNDGQLAQKLMHPKHEVQKTYHAVLDKPLAGVDLLAIRKGLRLKDGRIKVDDVGHIIGKRRNAVRVVLHSGKYRIVRRIFEHLGYKVAKLDRVRYSFLTKKGLSIGSWRFLNAKELAQLRGL